MGNINQVVVNGQNYEIEDKTARNYYPDTKQSAAVVEENSYKIVDKNGNTLVDFKSDSEYHKNDSTYFKGLGGYDGTNESNLCKSIQEIISDFETIIDTLEKNSYKVINYNITSNVLTSLTVNDVEYTNKEDIVEQLKSLEYCVKKTGNAPYYRNRLCEVCQPQIPNHNKTQLIELDATNSNLGINIVEINWDDLKCSITYKNISFDLETRISNLETRIVALETRIAALEKNSYKVINFNINSDTLTSLTVDDVEYTNKEDIVEQLKQLKYCVRKLGSAPYYTYNLCIISNPQIPNYNKTRIITLLPTISNSNVSLSLNNFEINWDDLSVTSIYKTITLE